MCVFPLSVYVCAYAFFVLFCLSCCCLIVGSELCVFHCLPERAMHIACAFVCFC